MEVVGYGVMNTIFLIISLMALIVVVGIDARRKRRDYLRDPK